jgi:hypothetical protein
MTKNTNDDNFSPFFDVPEEILLNGNNTSLPEIIIKTSKTLGKLHPYLPKNMISQVVIIKIVQVLTSKRITFNESGKKRLINWFSLLLFESGGGKDRLIDDVDEYLLADFKNWFREKILNPEQDKKAKNNNVPLEFEDSTPAGIYALAETYNKFDVGNIFIKMPETGFYIKNANKNQLKFLSDLCKLSDCKIPRTLTKSEGFTEEITTIPINVLAYSDYTLFLSDIKDIFNSMMLSGLCRRFTISFQPQQEWRCTILTDEEETALREELMVLGKELFSIFEKIEIGASYKLLPEAKMLLNDYKKKIQDKYNKTNNILLKREIRDRILKALKLSCIIACLKHPTEQFINEYDIQPAIDTIEFLSEDFERFVNYNAECNDRDFIAFKYLENHLGTAYGKTALIAELCKHCKYTRRGLVEYFNKTGSNNFFSSINEIAKSNGYEFVTYENKNRNGMYYYLKKLDNPDTEPQIINVNDVINA